MTKSVLMASLLTCSLLAASPVGAQSIPAPAALVISNSKYAALPALPTCDLSANLVSAVLSRAGFKVTRQNDLSNARLGTAIAALGEDATATPNSRTLIYVCSYVSAYADRLFLLPAEVRLDRDTDVLTGGIVARLLMSSVASAGSEAGLVLMDVAVPPGKGVLDFSSMPRPADVHAGLLAAGLPANASLGPAPLASALSEAIGSGSLEVGGLLTTLSANPALRRSILINRPPSATSWLLGGPAPPSSPPSPPPLPTPEPAVSATRPAAPAPQPPVAASLPPAASALAEPNPAERRRLQLALSRLGYYRGRIDGVFALDTSLAIRQFQRDSNAEPTGKLTTKQMEQLLQ